MLASEAPHPPVEREHGFPIVGIGASAGGLSAIEAFFSAMPTDRATGMAFVLVQHLAPNHKSMLRDLVKRYTRMEVFEVEDGMEVRPDCAYIIPPNRDMAFIDGTLQLIEPTERRGLRLPIDFFFRSLAHDQHERAICVVLSGTGSDGTLGVRAVKGEGGLAIAQDPATTEHDGMPRSAIATGLVDYVLAPERMWERLEAYVAHASERTLDAKQAPVESDGTLRKLALLLRSQTGHDFAQYKENTLVRRLQRRMAMHQIESPQEYLRFARENASEIEALFRDLLIGVTNFFRDPDAFALLEQRVVPSLIANKPAGAAIRVWVCGCSTGEEAYSIAILLYEHASALKTPYKLQVFATDIDRRAIETARAGVFPPNIATDISAERLARYFTELPEGGYRIVKAIRDLIVFSQQDVLRDPPFSKIDLISCRNLLIYLNGDAQKKLIALFHFALRPGGWLFLGTSETVGELASLFEAVDRKGKLYSRREDGSAIRPPVWSPPARVADAEPAPHDVRAVEPAAISLRTLTERALLEHFGQVALLVTARGDV
ncbi:MAG TPA: chemotaxis protein CheB, partial [Myxococcota bacterium]|nr:chemotaxis protein CheB [Myxococcota bacterium]